MRKEFVDIVGAKKSRAYRLQRSFFYTATSGEFWKPFSCIGFLQILFRLSCFSILSHYTAPFLDKALILSLDPLVAAIIIGIIRLVFSLAAFPLVHFTSKRIAFIVGGSASTLGMLLGK